MHPLVILFLGIVIVVGGILVFRLHAFLALIVAAGVVAALTPSSAIERYWLMSHRIPIAASGQHSDELILEASDLAIGTPLVLMEPRDGRLTPKGQLRVVRLVESGAGDGKTSVQAVARIVGNGGDGSIPPDAIVVTPADAQAARRQSRESVGERVAFAFGSTCGKIGILIALAAIIGKCLLESGAADRIVRSALGVVGERGAPAAFLGSGFLLGIPVFFDTVFYLMMPLGKAMWLRTGRNYLLYVLTIVAGASMAHSLVPPTPGPLVVAGELGVDLGLMILVGTAIGLCSSLAAYLYAIWINRRAIIPLRDSPEFSRSAIEALARRDVSELPSLVVSLAPILLPVVLIAGQTVVKELHLVPPGRFDGQVIATLGNKNVALAIAAAVAMATLVWTRRTSLRELANATQTALASGGVIILITAAGGAFGAMLRQTGIAQLLTISEMASLGTLVLAFFVTAGIRTAQGSATVAMITAVGILSGFADQLPCHPVWLAAAIGCGSKPIGWMNDSGFWVICKMSGMTEAEGLRFVTPMGIVMGVVGLLATLVGASLLPLK